MVNEHAMQSITVIFHSLDDPQNSGLIAKSMA